MKFVLRSFFLVLLATLCLYSSFGLAAKPKVKPHFGLLAYFQQELAVILALSRQHIGGRPATDYSILAAESLITRKRFFLVIIPLYDEVKGKMKRVGQELYWLTPRNSPDITYSQDEFYGPFPREYASVLSTANSPADKPRNWGQITDSTFVRYQGDSLLLHDGFLMVLNFDYEEKLSLRFFKPLPGTTHLQDTLPSLRKWLNGFSDTLFVDQADIHREALDYGEYKDMTDLPPENLFDVEAAFSSDEPEEPELTAYQLKICRRLLN